MAPGAQGILAFPVSSLSESGLTLSFTDPFGNLVEDARFHPGETEPELPVLDGGTPDIRFDRDNLTVEGEDFILRFSKETGLITQGYVRGVLTVTGGPYLHLTGLYLKPWQLNEIAGEVTDGCAIVTITGGYGEVRVRFRVRIDRTGLMETAYELLDMPYPSPRKLAMRVGTTRTAADMRRSGFIFAFHHRWISCHGSAQACGIRIRTGTSGVFRGRRKSTGRAGQAGRRPRLRGSGSWMKRIRCCLVNMMWAAGAPVIFPA